MIRRLLSIAVCGLLVLACGGCSTGIPEEEKGGPQLKLVPVNFGLDRKAESRRVVLEQLPLTRRLGYFLRGDDGTASIILSRHEGLVTESEVEEMLAERGEAWARSGVTFGEIEEDFIDDRSTWMWFERGPRTRRLVAIIPYELEGEVWTVDYYTAVQSLQDDEAMRRHVMSFARDPKREERSRVYFFFVVLVGLALFVAWYFRKQRQYRRVRRM